MLRSLNHILATVENQPQWQGPQEFQRLLEVWSDVVGKAVADQTRPCSISRDVLYVAASSSVWVQELKFRRRPILKKLNVHLSTSLTDIHFSTTQWQENSAATWGPNSAKLWQEHPSRVKVETSVASSDDLPQDASSTFQNWAKQMQVRSQSLPLCPQCQCPTPPGELKRWSVCGLCAVKKWQL